MNIGIVLMKESENRREPLARESQGVLILLCVCVPHNHVAIDIFSGLQYATAFKGYSTGCFFLFVL